MSRPYNAFISYRHHPLDSRIAGEIQRLLEGFQVPASLRKQNGAAKIDRLFRDKTELPITSDINDDILQALADSEFLIVICSTHTGESIWVEREIREFLRTHSQENILTVLADGEPQDVIPAILQTKTQQITDENGVTREVSIPVEPLSCDFRQYGTWKGRRTARREELPRLAAKLLHCAYDDLCQRQRQQQMRRLTITLSAAAVAMACLTGYFLWSNLQIRENYEQALTNQSMYLSRESLEQLDEGNRMAALELALAALPSEEMDRPWLPQAEYALSRATNAYVTPVMHDATPICIFESSSYINDYCLSQDGNYLYAVDHNHVVSVWDTASCQLIYSITDFPNAGSIYLAAEDSVLVVMSSDTMHGYDSRTGELLWRHWGEGEQYSSSVLSADTNFLYKYQYQEYDDDAGTWSLSYGKLDAYTGDWIDDFQVPPPAGTTGYNIQSFDLVVSPDGRYIAYFYSDAWVEDMSDHRVAVYDTVLDKVTYFPFTFRKYVTNLWFTPQNDLLIFGKETTDDEAGISRIYCMDLAGDTVRWSVEAPTTLYSTTLMYAVEYPEKYAEGYGILCVARDAFLLYDSMDGTLLGTWAPLSEHVETAVSGSVIRSVFANGELEVVDLNSSSRIMLPSLPKSSLSAKIVFVSEDKVLYVTEASTSLLLYESTSQNDTWKAIESGKEFGDLYSYHVTSYGVLISDYDGVYTMIDPDTLEILWKFSEAEQQDNLWAARDGTILASRREEWLSQEHTTLTLEMIGLSAEKDAALFCLRDNMYNAPFNDEQDILIRLDLASGTVSAAELPESFGYTTIYGTNKGTIHGASGGKIVAFYDGYDVPTQLVVMQDDGTELYRCTFPLPEEAEAEVSFMEISPDGKKVLFRYEHEIAGPLFLVDLNTGEMVDMAEDMEEIIRAVSWSQDGQRIVAVMEHRLCIYDMAGELLLELPMEDQKPVSAYFYGEDLLLVLCEDGHLYRYHAEEGTLLGRCELGNVSNPYYWYETKDGKIILQNGDATDVIDTKHWMLQAQVENCLCYVPERDIFLTQAYTPATHTGPLGYFRRYTLDELTALAQEQLGDFQLDEVARQEFGLDYGT